MKRSRGRKRLRSDGGKRERDPAACAHIHPTSSRKPAITEATLCMGGAAVRLPLGGGKQRMRKHRSSPPYSLLIIWLLLFITSFIHYRHNSLLISVLNFFTMSFPVIILYHDCHDRSYQLHCLHRASSRLHHHCLGN